MEAARLYGRASEMAPDNHELRFWAGLGAAQSGDFDAALEHVRAAIAMQPGWRELLPRIPADVAPAAAAVLARLDALLAPRGSSPSPTRLNAVTSTRPYRQSRSHREAIAILHEEAGTTHVRMLYARSRVTAGTEPTTERAAI